MQQGIMLEPEPAARPPLPRTRFKLQRNAKCTVLERHSKQLVPSFSPLRRCSPIDTWIIHCKRFSNKTVDTKDWANWDFIVPLQNHRLVLISCLTPIPSPKTPRHQWPKALTSPKKTRYCRARHSCHRIFCLLTSWSTWIREVNSQLSSWILLEFGGKKIKKAHSPAFLRLSSGASSSGIFPGFCSVILCFNKFAKFCP